MKQRVNDKDEEGNKEAKREMMNQLSRVWEGGEWVLRIKMETRLNNEEKIKKMKLKTIKYERRRRREQIK